MTLGENSRSEESVHSPKERTRKGRGTFKSPISSTINIKKDSASKESIDVNNKKPADVKANNDSEISEFNKLSLNSETKSDRSNSTHSLEEWEKLALEDQEEDKPTMQLDFETTTCLEVAGFPPQFKTHDVVAIFKSVDTSGIKLKWVNDTSAIAIFPDQEIGKLLLISKTSIKPCAHPNQNSPPSSNTIRPTTTDMVARRLIAGALGMRPPKKSQEEKQSDELKLYNARERKEQTKRDREKREKELEDAWNS
ncbi:Coiled-coil domain-containing protein r3hcc1l [Boothiomyces sp. JEL0866]|nr:Coiled-coil domain-containing protein r3hcc1l [Boothiomyces sp. JEL0866]